MDASMRFTGLIGHPIGHSRSPALQQAAFDALGIAARYELWDTAPERLAERVAALREFDMLGANVTIPYKTAVLPLLDVVAPEAARYAGAVNTIVRQEAAWGVQLVGHNTDVSGLRRALREAGMWDGERRRMLVLGAGGAARAALGVALLEGAEPWIAARRVEAARTELEALWRRQQDGGGEAGVPCPSEWLARALSLGDREALRGVLAETSVLIQATPVGTGDADASPLDVSLLGQLPSGAFVFDMIYSPPETALVRSARACGLRAEGGLKMLLYQGAGAFTLWTGRAAPLDLMAATLGLDVER
jgi:shikimate dehydrogenase